MKRRTFCASTIAVSAVAAIPFANASVSVLSREGKQLSLSRSDIKALKAGLRGQLLFPGQAGYDDARRVWNGAFDRRPAMIARCASASDVAQAVHFASQQDLLVAVRGGGHSLSGQSTCEGGLLIDLSPMKRVRIDSARRTAKVEPGVLLGEFDREAQAVGLATTAGTVSHTGAAGLTLGGGFGRICRKYGLACDNVLGMDIVPASGVLLQANARQNADLFWGLRGGGGNFGVVTSFEYQLHSIGPVVYGGVLVYPVKQARDVLKFMAGFTRDAPQELNTDMALTTGPDGSKVLIVDTCYSGPLERGEQVLKPLRQFRAPVVDGAKPTPYVELQSHLDPIFPVGRKYYTKSGFLRSLDPALIEEAVGRFESTPLRRVNITFPQHGGAVGNTKPRDTAFWHRDAQYSVLVDVNWDDAQDEEALVAWHRSTWKALESFTHGFYVNDISQEDPERKVLANYGGNYEQLVDLKTKHDPGNLFHRNANIKPRRATG